MDKNRPPNQTDEEYIEKLTEGNPRVILIRIKSKKSDVPPGLYMKKYLSSPIKKDETIKFFGGSHTSKVDSVKILKETGEIIIETKNSIYTLKILEKKLLPNTR